MNLITKKHRDVHISQLKIFHFDPTKLSPTDTARRDYMEFFIEEIISHRGEKKTPSKMSFLVKWLNYGNRGRIYVLQINYMVIFVETTWKKLFKNNFLINLLKTQKSHK